MEERGEPKLPAAAERREETAEKKKPSKAMSDLARLLGKGVPGPIGPQAPTPGDPKAVSQEAQSIRLGRLLLKH